MPEWLEEILSKPTASVPDTGRALAMSRNHAYECVKRGEIPALRMGGKLIVPTAWIREALRLKPEAAA
jgi:hypothetical protein